MIKFDPASLTVEIIRLKSVTTAVGGSILIVDEANTTDQKEAHTRIAVSAEVVRSFIKKTHSITKYLKPTYTALVKYNGSVIAMERHPLSSMGELESEGVFGMKRWEPNCALNIDNILTPMIERSDRQWYFDGRYVYSFESPDLMSAVRDSERLTSDGNFRKVITNALDVHSLSNAKAEVGTSQRSCVAFVTSNGKGVVSPPIWKNISNVGVTQMRGITVDDDEDDEPSDTVVSDNFSFDNIDNTLSVNLNFALKAGADIGRMFGYESVEPIQLPRLMVELCTVNLPNIPKEVKATYDIGMTFTHAMSWLLGLMHNAKTLDNYIAMRYMLKFLTKRGIFRRNVFAPELMFKQNMSINDVPLMSVEDIMDQNQANERSLASMVADGMMDLIPLLNGPTDVEFEVA